MTKAIEEVYSSLKGQFRGDLIRPGDDDYETARGIWYAMVAHRPGLIARCADVPDIQSAVSAASTTGVVTAVRCGGHSLAGFGSCADGLVIDLSRMRQVTVDRDARRARLAGGCLLGSVDVATQKYGLVFPAGVVSHTGASGLILGGGFGWLTRRFGLSCDNVEGLTLVTADGSVVHASSRDNADLFWALRGGGGNFGVVTEFEVKLHPLKSVVLGEGLCLGDDILRLLRHWRDFMPQAPDDLKWNLSLRIALDSENVPRRVCKRPVLSQSVLWTGNPKESRRYLDHALSICKPIEITRRVLSFLALQTMADAEFPHGRRYYTKSGYFKTLDDSSIDHMPEAYQERWERLVAIKSHYDPDNLFRLNQNIRPQKRSATLGTEV